MAADHPPGPHPLNTARHIFEGDDSALVPQGFDAVTLVLEAGMRSDLDWRAVRHKASQAVEKGYALLWHMQLGLFQEQSYALDNQSQFLALGLALEHFRDTLWKEFAAHTIGLALFQGSADFSQGFGWSSSQQEDLQIWLRERQGPCLPLEELHREATLWHWVRLFCSDVAAQYFSLLSRGLPDTLPLYLYLDASKLSLSLADELQLLHPERYAGFQLALKGHRLPFEAWGWGTPTAYGYSGLCYAPLPEAPLTGIGLVIPPASSWVSAPDQAMQQVIIELQRRAIPFRLVAEERLTSAWEGLDYLLYAPFSLSAAGKRKLMGFCAAGGVVVSLGDPIGFAQEMTVQQWWLQTAPFLMSKKS